MTAPSIIRDARGVLLYVCPVCGGHGKTTVYSQNVDKRDVEKTLPLSVSACKHCFGFGRLPVPSWYAAQATDPSEEDEEEDEEATDGDNAT